MQLILLLTILFLFAAYSGLIIYYGSCWRRIPNSKFKIQNSKFKISIIIPARNEEQNIKACLDSILQQNYPADFFEVIVVDDHSTDNTAAIVLCYETGNIKLISLKDFTNGEQINSYKKKAIETAIDKSTGELIISTDADCIVPPNWLQIIANFYQQTDASFIVMPVKFIHKNNWLNIFQSLDFMTLQGITGAAVHNKMLSMCNGANLAYRKKSFEAVDGFKGIDGIASGDDMLLMHKIFEREPDKVLYLKSPEVIVQTQAMPTVKDFFNQRIRWASKADQYKDKRIFWVLLLVYLVNLLLIILPLFAWFYNIQYSIFNFQFSMFAFWVLLLLSKTITELFFLFPVANFFGNKRLLWFFPLAQPFHIFYTVIAGWLGKFGNYQWKGRTVK